MAGRAPRLLLLRTTALLYLFFVVIIVALPHVNAAAAVTTASCAVNADGSCLNTTVSFTGTDLDKVASVRIGLTPADEALIKCDTVKPSAKAVTCTLAVASSAKAGLYPATLALSDGTQVEAGSFLIGNTYEQKSLPRWTSTTKSSNYRVTGQSSDWPSTGDTWSVSGTFNPASTYSIVFYNNQKKAAIDSPGTPTCAPVKVTATTLTCTITSANGVMGMYNFLVRDSTNNALLLGSSSLPMLAVNPPLPEVTGASGDCATLRSPSRTAYPQVRTLCT
ncbi:hypothetical protein ABB37_07503 [Leptomonas pyrrhocoris]|uniref:Uncharacterized protein n=1 Tax=Leptomonas pyrrhocoris TaxID=157538 RepID=A0A0M9FV86_LEPPY|nr:hypothetical protein ABB37_07503 [Leptomonas pyrrhocoris]KPA76647.1 hypothetical protein ABB37_07503 [Leptomonas pyrrhocoris]|eukprot:XP_015655086.1 hypothetical protein ABB37_07503 [Leptomonas pyrrhocoris]